MLVSHRRQFIYTKTKKTAGTSVESYFEPYCQFDGEWKRSPKREEYSSAAGIVGYRGEGRPRDCMWWKHMPAALIKERLGNEIWEKYFKFCVIRNPFEKAISGFFFYLKVNGLPLKDPGHPQEQFIEWLDTVGPPTDRDIFLINGRFCLDDVIRYEKLNEDMERICQRLGIPWAPGELPGFKKGIRPTHATVEYLYTEKSRKIIEKIYAFELDYFGYAYPVPESLGSGARA